MNRRKFRKEMIRIHEETIQLRKDEYIQTGEFKKIRRAELNNIIGMRELREKELKLTKKCFELEEYKVAFNDDLLKENMKEIYKACVEQVKKEEEAKK